MKPIRQEATKNSTPQFKRESLASVDGIHSGTAAWGVGLLGFQVSSIFLGGYYGIHYRVRLYPPFGV